MQHKRKKQKCLHPLSKLLRIRGSLMCAVCYQEVDRYGSALDKKLMAYHDKQWAKKHD